jgi:hypothetical protein
VICPALAAWLRPFRKFESGPVWKLGDSKIGENKFHKKVDRLRKLAKVARKSNALRHSFCTYHFARYSNENLTAAQAGNSPGMIHSHYKGLATKREARAWFAVKPAKAEGNVVEFNAEAKL